MPSPMAAPADGLERRDLDRSEPAVPRAAVAVHKARPGAWPARCCARPRQLPGEQLPLGANLALYERPPSAASTPRTEGGWIPVVPYETPTPLR